MKTKSIFLLAAFCFVQALAWAQPCSNLFFSEYLEGASNNKAIEIYNPTNHNISLSDYKIYRYNNGSPTAQDSLLLQGTIAPGGVYVAGNPSAIAGILSVSDTLHTITFFNGDDVLSLYQISTNTFLDIIGIIGVDPGVNWPVGTGATSEFTLVRRIDINQGELNWAVSATEWDVYPQNTTTYLGAHTITPCCSTLIHGITVTQCDSMVSPSGLYTYTSTNTYMDTLLTIEGCDSVIMIDLTINNSSSTSPVINICAGESYTVGLHTYTVSGLYHDTLSTVHGCDSIIATSLTVEDAIDVSTSFNFFTTIHANQAGAAYQWLDCNNAYAPLVGETGQTFNATANGSYAVEVTLNGCADTSLCVNVTSVGLGESAGDLTFGVSPNPSNGQFILTANAHSDETIEISIFNSIGMCVYKQNNVKMNANSYSIELPNAAAGMYLLKINGNNTQTTLPMIVE